MHSAQPALPSVAVPVGHWMLQSLEQMLQVSRNASHSSWKWTFQLRHPPQPTLTILAALAGVAGRAQTGSGGGVTAGVVGTVGADLLAARSPETLRASWTMSRQRTHSTGIRAQVAEGNVCPFGLPLAVIAVLMQDVDFCSQHVATSEHGTAVPVPQAACEPSVSAILSSLQDFHANFGFSSTCGELQGLLSGKQCCWHRDSAAAVTPRTAHQSPLQNSL